MDEKWVDLMAHCLEYLMVHLSAKQTDEKMVGQTVEMKVDLRGTQMAAWMVLQMAELMALQWAQL